MHHVALDRPGAHDRDLDDEIVELARLEARQHRHLGAAFDLKDADRIGAAQHLVNARVFGRDRVERVRATVMLLDQRKALADAGQHAEREDVDLENVQGVEIVLVPFDEGAVRHRRVFDRHELRQGPAGDHKAANML